MEDVEEIDLKEILLAFWNRNNTSTSNIRKCNHNRKHNNNNRYNIKLKINFNI